MQPTYSPFSIAGRECWLCEHFRGSHQGRIPACKPPSGRYPAMTGMGGCCEWTAADREPMRVLVCGGRGYDDQAAAFAALDKLWTKRRVTLVIHGAAKGADTLADQWAQERGIKRLPFEVTREDWRRIGPSAGPKRNARMLAEGCPDGVVALPGGRGTEDMVMQSIAAGAPVWRPYG